MMTKDVLFATNEKFVPIMMTAIVSLLETNKTKLVLHILCDEVEKDSQNNITNIVEKYGCTVEFYDIAQYKYIFDGHLLVTANWPEIGLMRLIAGDILPAEIHQILYLDCDIVVNSDLNDLMEIDLNNFIVAGVCESISDSYKASIGLKNGSIYINAGILLMNLDMMREDAYKRALAENIEHHGTEYQYLDQDVINVTMESRILQIPLKYNVFSHMYAFSYKEYTKYRNGFAFYSETEYDQALEKPAILHFASGFAFARPWFKSCNHPLKGLYEDNCKKANGEIVYFGDDNRSTKQKIVAFFYWHFKLFRKIILPTLRRLNNA